MLSSSDGCWPKPETRLNPRNPTINLQRFIPHPKSELRARARDPGARLTSKQNQLAEWIRREGADLGWGKRVNQRGMKESAWGPAAMKPPPQLQAAVMARRLAGTGPSPISQAGKCDPQTEHPGAAPCAG